MRSIWDVSTAFQPEGSIDGFFDQLLAPAQAVPAQALDMQISIGGTDLFPTAVTDTSSFLDGSTQALILGPTGIPNPDLLPGYIPTVDRLYLEPLGFPSDGTITPLVTPETPDFGPSIAAGEQNLITAVEADYNAGVISAADPLTITAYSQSTVDATLAEPILADYGIPEADLRLVLLGDATANPNTGPTGILDTFGNTTLGKDAFALLGWSNLNDATTPNDLYPTTVYTVTNDFWADWSADHWIDGFFQHGDYMGLTEAQIQAGTSTIDGLTNYITIPDPASLIDTLLQTALNDIGLPM
jgi:hypothetical protein